MLDPHSGNVYELSSVVWEVAEALDGERSANQIAEQLEIGRRHVQEVLRRLEGLELLADGERSEAPPSQPVLPQWRRGPVPETFELVLHPEARFRCVGVGVCCERGYVIPVRADQVEGLRAAARARAQGEADPVTLWPGEPGEPWGYALDNDEGCVFHDAEAGCTIHEQAAQPDACQVFPFVFARVGESIIVSQSYRCGCGVGGEGPRLADQGEEVARRLLLSPHVPAVPETAQLDATRHLAGARAVEVMLVASTRAEADPWGALEQTLQELLRESGEGLDAAVPDVGLSDLREALEAAATPALAAALRGEVEISATALRPRLSRAGVETGADGDQEIGRFARDHIFGARPFQQATLTHGLALFAALLDSAHGAGLDEVQARARLMAWDDIIPQGEVRVLLASLGHPLAEDAAALLRAVRGRV